MEIMNLCVLHLSDVERESGTGVDREELVQWYLEQKELEFESEEDLEYETELIGKALNKLAKVSAGGRERGERGEWGAVGRTKGGSNLRVQRSETGDSPNTKNSRVQDNYLLEIRGDVREGLRPSAEDSLDSAGGAGAGAEGEGGDGKVYYVVHPQVDLSDLGSSGA